MVSYLRDRSQGVVTDGVKSDLQDLQYGTPRGLVLGPILFTIHAHRCHCTAVQTGNTRTRR